MPNASHHTPASRLVSTVVESAETVKHYYTSYTMSRLFLSWRSLPIARNSSERHFGPSPFLDVFRQRHTSLSFDPAKCMLCAATPALLKACRQRSGLAMYAVSCAEFAELILQCISVYKTLTSARGKFAVNTAVATRSVATSASAPTATDSHPIIAPVKVCTCSSSSRPSSSSSSSSSSNSVNRPMGEGRASLPTSQLYT